MNGYNALRKEIPQTPLALLAIEDTERRWQPRRRPSPNHAGTLTLDFWLPELGEINFSCLDATQMWCFVIGA